MALKKSNYNKAMALVLALIILSYSIAISQGLLRVGFYSQTCPNAEAIVSSVVQEAITSDFNVAAILLRLHFHDCFVQFLLSISLSSNFQGFAVREAPLLVLKISNYNNAMALVLALIILSYSIGISQGQLRVGFYSQTCPDAEAIVSSVVQEAITSDFNMAAILLRLHFHDCFGCDGSILIDNGPNAEKQAFSHQGVRGFAVIEKAKAELESACRGVVSCADIVALAARDAVALTNGPVYQIPTGRRDGRISNISLAADMPDVTDSIQVLKAKFVQKGLSDKDLVLLSGLVKAAHSIGTTACFFVKRRLYNFFSEGGSDPAINPQFLPELQAKCPQNGDNNMRLPMDDDSEQTFDDQILRNIRDGFAVLESDARLYDDESTKSIIDSYFGFLSSIFGPFFEQDFASAMVNMGYIGVKTGSQGEVRHVCNAFN
ncbi:hypothetical protein HHK36_007923 [Tetracentron sinense]|uniref:peroxidase n=1 Tax=Tetracentron sinense TaxID=13715 RepID=A0A834ZLG7_TETSI|nr:hypothetical protein HHK36_007923 [Tetracentron sinense]